MNEHLENLKEIRSIMERSQKFLSLSGLSGVSAGIVALLASGIVFWKKAQLTNDYTPSNIFTARFVDPNFMGFLLQIGIITLVLAVLSAYYFTFRNAQKMGQKVWNTLSKNLLVSLFIPLLTGGVFCVGLVFNNVSWAIASVTLIFYGLALVNAAKYTHRDVFYLGLFEVILGLGSMFLPGFTLVFWAFGFGILHIAYGLSMYFKYDKKS
jgi:hypothetical protein